MCWWWARGPAGLTAAAALRRYGVEVLVLERKAQLSSTIRARPWSARGRWSCCARGGSKREIRAGGIPDVEMARACRRDLGRADQGEISEARPADEGAGCGAEPHGTPLRAAGQHRGSPARLGARSLGAEVGFGARGRATRRRRRRRRSPGPGRRSPPEGVNARYVIGADGAHSVVRSALDIEMRGPGALAPSPSAQRSRHRSGTLVRRPRYGLYPISPPGGTERVRPVGLWRRVGLRDRRRLDRARRRGWTMTRLMRIAAGVPDLEPRIQQDHHASTSKRRSRIASQRAARS